MVRPKIKQANAKCFMINTWKASETFIFVFEMDPSITVALKAQCKRLLLRHKNKLKSIAAVAKSK